MKKTNTIKLFKKEWSLVIKPSVFVFIYALLPLVMLSPEYPYFIAFWFAALGIPILFANLKANKDLEFTAMLPVSRADVVKSKFLTVLYIEIQQLVVAIPFAIASAFLNPSGNTVGIDANATIFASALLSFAAFNFAFMPLFFKTGYKTTLPTIVSFIAYFIIAVAIELLVGLVPPLYTIFDGYTNLGWQFVFLAVSLIIFIALTYVSYRISVKKFERVSL